MKQKDKIIEIIRKRISDETHPITIFLFYIFAILCPMFTLHPLILTISASFAALYVGIIFGRRVLRKWLLGFFPFSLIVILANTLSSHYGESILFYLNGNPITKEAIIRGALMALVIYVILLWGVSMQRVITTEMLIYLFGTWAPRLGLTISMALHYIPELYKKFNKVHETELAMGYEGKKRVEKIRQSVKEFSTVLSWSLEDAIETGDTMEARGYGLNKKSTYRKFLITTKDMIAIILILILGIDSLLGILQVSTEVHFYPTFELSENWIKIGIVSMVYIFLLCMPLIKWVLEMQKYKRKERGVGAWT